MSPIQLLQQELDVYKKALLLAKRKFADGIIDAKQHDIYVSNLEPKIAKYTKALKILRIYMD